MVYFSPTPRGMSRTLTKWLALHGAGHFLGVDDLLGKPDDNRTIEYIMRRHHPKIYQMRPRFSPDVKTFGIVRDPLNRVWSAYIRFGKQGESFDNFWMRWVTHAPNDKDMLHKLDLVIQFELGPESIYNIVRSFTGFTGPTKIINDSHKAKQPKRNLTAKQEERIRRFYAWTYDNFKY